MYIKLGIDGIVIEEFNAKRILKIDCPNKFGGIGNITIKNIQFYMKNCWFTTNKLNTQFSNITFIKYCYDRDYFGDETKWTTLWKYEKNKKFSYEYWFNASKKLKTLIHAVLGLQIE